MISTCELTLLSSSYQAHHTIRSDWILDHAFYPYPYPQSSDQVYHEEYHSMLRSATPTINAAYVCLGFEMVGMISGSTTFLTRVNIFQAWVHFCGSILTCWFAVYGLDVRALHTIVGWTTVPTTILELLVLISLCCVQTPTHW